MTGDTITDTEPNSLNELTISTVLDEWNMRTFRHDESYRQDTEHTVFWNESETRSLKVREKTMPSGSVETEIELADISGDHAVPLDLSRTFL